MDAQGDGCAGFFIVANLPLATRLSVSYIEDLGFFGYTVVPLQACLLASKLAHPCTINLITTAFW